MMRSICNEQSVERTDGRDYHLVMILGGHPLMQCSEGDNRRRLDRIAVDAGGYAWECLSNICTFQETHLRPTHNCTQIVFNGCIHTVSITVGQRARILANWTDCVYDV
jgi:hypothetical protein